MHSTLENAIILKSVSIFAETSNAILTEALSLLEEVDFKAGEARPIYHRGIR
jgi:hypothetical protein